MLSLEHVIHEELLSVPSRSKTKETVLRELSYLLEKNGYLKDRQQFLEDVYRRELDGITGIGRGVAIPHGKSTSVLTTTIAIAILEHEIEWETLDDKPVKVVILFAVQETDATTTHLVLLQHVAQLLAHDDFLEQLVHIKSVPELAHLFTTALL